MTTKDISARVARLTTLSAGIGKEIALQRSNYAPFVSEYLRAMRQFQHGIEEARVGVAEGQGETEENVSLTARTGKRDNRPQGQLCCNWD
jgi:hypothetical protein